MDESALFRMIGQMREIVTTAQKATRRRGATRIDASISRQRQRRQNHATTGYGHGDPQADNQPPAKPFDQIEEW